jgi:hypothetical protein
VAYYKVRIEDWCDWDPEESDLEEFAQNIRAGEASVPLYQVRSGCRRKSSARHR